MQNHFHYQYRIGAALMGVCLLLITGFPRSLPAAELIDRIVAVVNEDIIVLSELEDAFEPYSRQIKAREFDEGRRLQMETKVRNDLLTRLIEEKLTDQQIRKANITIDKAEIDATVERLKSANGLSDDDMAAALKQQGMSLEEYRDQIKQQIQRRKLVTLEVQSKIVVTDQDIREYYESHPDEFTGESRVHLRHLTQMFPEGAAGWALGGLQMEMEAIKEQLNAGVPWTDVEARFTSEGKDRRAGDLGEFRLSTLSPQLREAVSAMENGGITDLLKTDQGFQIFYVEDIKRASTRPLEMVSDAIADKIYKERVDEKFKQWLSELKKTAMIKVTL